jgi:hypothetical protein
MVSRHWHDEALPRMQRRATLEAMRLRRSTVEHPLATLKFHFFAYPRFLLRSRRGAQAEMSMALIVYNLNGSLKGTTIDTTRNTQSGLIARRWREHRSQKWTSG